MLEILGTIVANILSLPGVLGLALGMTTRNPILAAGLGALVGLFEAMVFSGFSFARLDGSEAIFSIVVGLIFGLLGCGVRRKGAAI